MHLRGSLLRPADPFSADHFVVLASPQHIVRLTVNAMPDKNRDPAQLRLKQIAGHVTKPQTILFLITPRQRRHRGSRTKSPLSPDAIRTRELDGRPLPPSLPTGLKR